MDTLARAPGGQMRGAATKAMSDIAEERQQSRCPPAAAPLRAAARRPAGFVARSPHTAPGIARRSRLASGPGGQQQSVHIISLQTLVVQRGDSSVSLRVLRVSMVKAEQVPAS